MARRAPIRVTAIERELGTVYTAETLERLVARFPQHDFIWLMGADNLGQFHRWRDWRRIAALYDALRAAMPSPVVELNRAIAHGMAFGPEAGLALLAELEAAPALRGYAPLPAAKGDALYRAGRLAEARTEFERAAGLTRNARERDFLSARAAACG